MFTQFFGTDLYHVIAAFVLYSILGWFVESVYMSFCNRQITNRGFMKSPFCPIYGFGAVFGTAVLSPLKGNVILLYFTGAILATTFEFLVGKLMLRIFGKLWWDYSEKPFNYKGILCLESTVAWGFYAIGIVIFLHHRILNMIDLIPMTIGMRILVIVLLIVTVDFVHQMIVSLHVNIKDKKDWIREHLRTLRG
ncbi:MAG: putative ABC transporter permease [Lachnospiraceae bacterium]|jgi:uncharacterized membrane protein|nr:putative ABC transporter permease [Lachnospiraceae bacterium]